MLEASSAAAAPPLHLRVDERALREHDLSMQRIGIALLAACIVVPGAALWVAVELGILALVGALGVVLAVDMLLRARRGLAAVGDLVVTIDGDTIAYGRERTGGTPFRGGAPAVRETGRLNSAQAFPDHVQIVVGPPLRQLELPVSGDDRARLLVQLRAAGLAVGERMAVAPRLAIALTVFPALVTAGVLAYRAVVLIAFAGILAALQGLGPKAGLTCLALLSALAVYVRVRQALRKNTRPSP
jgi:hypothetical protein